jgi:hypothetical protein
MIEGSRPITAEDGVYVFQTEEKKISEALTPQIRR